MILLSSESGLLFVLPHQAAHTPAHPRTCWIPALPRQLLGAAGLLPQEWALEAPDNVAQGAETAEYRDTWSWSSSLANVWGDSPCRSNSLERSVGSRQTLKNIVALGSSRYQSETKPKSQPSHGLYESSFALTYSTYDFEHQNVSTAINKNSHLLGSLGSSCRRRGGPTTSLDRRLRRRSMPCMPCITFDWSEHDTVMSCLELS